MAASSQLLHFLFHPPESQPPPLPSSSFSLFLRFKLLFRSTASTITITITLSKSSLPQIPLHNTSHFTNFLQTPLFSQSFATLTPSPLHTFSASSALQEGETIEKDDDEEDFDSRIQEYDGEVESGSEDPELGGTDGETSQVMIVSSSSSSPLKLLGLSVKKKKKELASYAHSLGKKLKSQLVGKSAVTASVARSFIENLEANELLKLPIN